MHGNYLPQNIGKVNPSIRVLHRCKSTRLPNEATSLLQETLHGTASRTTVEPDGYFVYRRVDGRLEDEEERSGAIVHINWHQTRIHLADIKCNLRQGVHQVIYGSIRIFAADNDSNLTLTLGFLGQEAVILVRFLRFVVTSLNYPFGLLLWRTSYLCKASMFESSRKV